MDPQLAKPVGLRCRVRVQLREYGFSSSTFLLVFIVVRVLSSRSNFVGFCARPFNSQARPPPSTHSFSCNVSASSSRGQPDSWREQWAEFQFSHDRCGHSNLISSLIHCPSAQHGFEGTTNRTVQSSPHPCHRTSFVFNWLNIAVIAAPHILVSFLALIHHVVRLSTTLDRRPQETKEIPSRRLARRHGSP